MFAIFFTDHNNNNDKKCVLIVVDRLQLAPTSSRPGASSSASSRNPSVLEDEQRWMQSQLEKAQWMLMKTFDDASMSARS